MNFYRTDVSLEQPNLSKIELFLVFWLICISGNPLFSQYGGKYIYAITAMGALAVSFHYKKELYGERLKLWLLGSCALFVLQAVVLSEVSLLANVNFIVRLYLAFLITSFLGDKFRYAYMKVMAFVALLSLVLWGINNVVELPGIEFSRCRSILFFNYIIESKVQSGFINHRNCGMFWEPGAYQGYIMLVPLMYIGQIRELMRQYRKECIVLFLALLSTMSTTGYVVFAVLIMLILMKNIRNVVFKFFVAFSVVALFVWSYNSFDFIGKKIESQYESAMQLGTGEASWSRMGALRIDMENIKRHPIVGNGFSMKEKYGQLADEMGGAGNGFSGVLNMLGIPFMIFYFLQLFKNAPATTRYESMIVPFIVILLLNGEYFLNYPLFWSLMFVQYPDMSGSDFLDNEKEMQVFRRSNGC